MSPKPSASLTAAAPPRQARLRPASTLVEVTSLVDPRMKVEIEAMAYVG